MASKSKVASKAKSTSSAKKEKKSAAAKEELSASSASSNDDAPSPASDSSSSDSEVEKKSKSSSKKSSKDSKKGSKESKKSSKQSKKEESSSDESEDAKAEKTKQSDSDSDSSSESEVSDAEGKDEKVDAKASSALDADTNGDEKTETTAEAEENPKKRSSADDEPPTKKSRGEPTTMFVGRLSWNVDDDWLLQDFKGTVEGVMSARVITERESGRSKGYGYVDFESEEAATKALETMEGREIDGRPIHCDISTGQRRTPGDRAQQRNQRYGDQLSEPSDTIFVGNLSFNADRDAVYEAFSQHGNVLTVRLPTHPESGQPKGFGYVQFSSVDEAQNALNAMGGEYIAGRPVRLDYSVPRTPGGFGGNGGGNRGGSYSGSSRSSPRPSSRPQGRFSGSGSGPRGRKTTF